MASTPTFSNPDRVGTLFYPDVTAIAAEAYDAGLSPAADDETKILLLIIDMQVDFCHEEGSLHVPGARQDIRRLIAFIYRHAERITQITCSLDSHYPFQIFHAAWWADPEGRHPDPMTTITAEDVAQGRWRPLREPEWSVNYVKQLEAQSKKQLLIWPYHVPIGGVGNALDPELWSAVFWHALARGSQPVWWTKGSIPKTEHYSILQPEVPVPDHPQGRLSRDLMAALDAYDHVLLAGEAQSHCVLETAEDLVDARGDHPDWLRKLHILRDCMSPVRHPEIDFKKIADEQFERYERMGVRLIRSTEDLPF